MVLFGDQLEVTPENPHRKSDCYEENLALAVRENKEHITEFVESSTASGSGSASFIPAFEKAFSYFKPGLEGGTQGQLQHVENFAM